MQRFEWPAFRRGVLDVLTLGPLRAWITERWRAAGAKERNVLDIRTNCSYSIAMAGFPIIERLGGPAAVYELIGCELGLSTPRSVAMWLRRQSLPGTAIIRLMIEAEARGLAYTASDFLPVPTSPPPASDIPPSPSATGPSDTAPAAQSTGNVEEFSRGQ